MFISFQIRVRSYGICTFLTDLLYILRIATDYLRYKIFYAAERKKELLPFATAWMELESIMLSEISQVVKDKYHLISLISET